VFVAEQAALTASVSPDTVAVSMLIVKSLEIPADAGVAGATVVVVVGATVVVVVGAIVVVVTGGITGTRLDTSVIVSWLTKPVGATVAPPAPRAAKPLTPKPSATEATPTFWMNFFIFCSFLLTD
jgi:hypothetical protein